jgi:hypothetical protein
MFGRHRSYTSLLFAALPDSEAGGPPSGGGAPPPEAAPPGAPAPGAPKPAAPKPAAPPPEVPPTIDMESPVIKELLRKHGEEAASKAAAAARLAALEEAKAVAEEEKRVAALSAEERIKHEAAQLKQEAATAKGDKTRAENAAAAAAREASIFRQISLSGLVPQDDDVAAMVAAAAPKDIVPGDISWLTKLAASKPYLFKSGEVTPGTASPAEIVGAGKTTAPPASPAAAPPPGGTTNAHELSDEAWAELKKKRGLRAV